MFPCQILAIQRVAPARVSDTCRRCRARRSRWRDDFQRGLCRWNDAVPCGAAGLDSGGFCSWRATFRFQCLTRAEPYSRFFKLSQGVLGAVFWLSLIPCSSIAYLYYLSSIGKKQPDIQKNPSLPVRQAGFLHLFFLGRCPGQAFTFIIQLCRLILEISNSISLNM